MLFTSSMNFLKIESSHHHICLYRHRSAHQLFWFHRYSNFKLLVRQQLKCQHYHNEGYFDAILLIYITAGNLNERDSILSARNSKF